MPLEGECWSYKCACSRTLISPWTYVYLHFILLYSTYLRTFALSTVQYISIVVVLCASDVSLAFRVLV